MAKKRTAIVSGAGKGIGKAIAERLVTDGYFVYVVDVDVEAENTAATFGMHNAAFYHADVSDEIQVIALFKSILNERKTLDVLVNNAGIIRDHMIWNMTVADFDAVIRVNLKGAWLMCREAAKIMKTQQSGCMINIASRAWLGNRGQTNYSASKAGIIGLTRSLALELGKYNVYVNAVAPGLIDTPLTQALNPEILDQLIQAQPTKSIGAPEDVAHAVAFLASEKTHFITGQTLYVDGGKSIGAGI